LGPELGQELEPLLVAQVIVGARPQLRGHRLGRGVRLGRRWQAHGRFVGLALGNRGPGGGRPGRRGLGSRRRRRRKTLLAVALLLLGLFLVVAGEGGVPLLGFGAVE
jgi:hypothetical protein